MSVRAEKLSCQNTGICMMENSLLIYKKIRVSKRKCVFAEFIDNSDINGYSKDTCKEA